MFLKRQWACDVQLELDWSKHRLSPLTNLQFIRVNYPVLSSLYDQMVMGSNLISLKLPWVSLHNMAVISVLLCRLSVNSSNKSNKVKAALSVGWISFASGWKHVKSTVQKTESLATWSRTGMFMGMQCCGEGARNAGTGWHGRGTAGSGARPGDVKGSGV